MENVIPDEAANNSIKKPQGAANEEVTGFFFERIARLLSDFAWLGDLDDKKSVKLCWENERFLANYETPLADLFGQNKLRGLICEDSIPHLAERRAAIRARTPHEAIFHVRQEGKEAWFYLITDPLDLPQGGCGFMSAGVDFTKLMLSRRELQESQRRFKKISELSSDFAWATRVEPDGRRVLEWETAAARKTLGISLAELANRGGLRKIAHPDCLEVFEARKQAFNEGRRHEGVFHLLDKGGNERYIQITSDHEWNPKEGRTVRATRVGRDITTQARLEARLLEVRKMEAIGTLASGIAHDFNNILQVISGYTHLLGGRAWQEAEAEEDLSKINDAIARAAQLVRQLLAYASQVEGCYELVNLNESVEGLLVALGRTMPPRIAIEADLQQNLPPISADPVLIEQVLMTLLTNAQEAMPLGGKITITTQTQTEDENGAVLGRGPFVRLTVRDTGRGMDSETAERVFDPFFTTKPRGRSTGMSLATAFGIVKKLRGEISCFGNPGQGATFTMRLPAAAAPGAGRSAAPVKTRDVGDGSEPVMVLLVDDEVEILNIGRDALTRRGWRVVCAQTGQQALKIHQERGREIDVTVLDVGLPDMSGLDCLYDILHRDAAAKVIIATGYASEECRETAMERGAAGFLAKPFMPGAMVRAIDAILGRNNGKVKDNF